MTGQNENTRILLVTLTPLERFFFGGRKQTHADKGPKKDYYFRSQYFPQQTALLGMIRQELLIQNHLFPLTAQNRDDAAALIGAESFNPVISDKEQTFGAVKKISPLFIRHEQENRDYYIAPMDYGLDYREEKSGTYRLGPGTPSREFVPLLKGYDPKKGIVLQLVSAGGPDTLPLAGESTPAGDSMQGVFSEDQQVGIKKGPDGSVRDDAYYKQVFLRMRHGFAYAFYLELADNCRFENSIVYFGGERSAFALHIRQHKPPQSTGPVSLWELYHRDMPHCSRGGILLTGDAFVKQELLEHCTFAVTDSLFFRNIRTSVKHTQNNDYYKLGKSGQNHEPRLGAAVNLMKRGSVLFPDQQTDVAELCKEYLDIPDYQKIGYNFYIDYPNGNKNKGE